MSKRKTTTARLSWRWGAVAALAMLLVSLFPQTHFVAHRGSAWKGANAITHPDEVAYSAYLASLIRGRPRRSDPYTGQQDQSESLFSIQFVPAYTVALPSRGLGLSATTAFMILPALCALAASLTIFWFVWLLTRDEKFSAAAVLFILGFGTLIAGQGIVRHVLNLNYLIPLWISNRVSPTSLYSLPFLRLYQPAVAFPVFFVLCALVWLALTRANRRPAIIAAAGAGLLFALLFFSYFYLWTTAGAWLGTVGALWLCARSSDRKRTILVFTVVFGLALAASIQYGRMLAQRAASMDTMVALLSSRRPDLFRFSELVALLVLVFIGIGARRRVLQWRDPAALMAAAFALTVFVVFNQQIVTGKSLQPIHYEWYVANYCALVALVLVLALWRQAGKLRLSTKRLAIVALCAFVWAGGEVWLAARLSWDYNRAVDEARPVANQLESLARGGQSEPNAVVLMADLKLADRLPTDAPQTILWAPRMLVFPGVTEVENRERFYRQLYYLGYDEKKYWAQLDHADWNFLAGMFSYDRLSPPVSGGAAPITPVELRAQIANYLEYASTFNRERANSPALSYLVISAADTIDFTNLDRWYQRDAGERIGDFMLYRLKLRD